MNILSFSMSSLLLTLSMAFAASAESVTIATSENFQLSCPAYVDTCDEREDLRLPAEQIVAEMERIRTWFDELGFPQKSSLIKVDERELLLTGRLSTDVCGDAAVACHRIDILAGVTRVWLPLDRLAELAMETGTLAHEYLHSRQPAEAAGAADWLREAVATAVGEAWNTRNGRVSGEYPPQYWLSLDLPFHQSDTKNLAIDAGYRNWLYLLHLGERIGSEDRVAYLADPAFLNDRQYRIGGKSAAAMEPFYTAPTIGGASFDQIFPEFVSRYNNLDRYSDGKYYYYGAVREEALPIPDISLPTHEDYRGEVAAYAAAPLLLKLEVQKAPADTAPQVQLGLAEIEIVESDALEDLTLVAEHRLATSQHKISWLIDGSDPPDELGLYRIVHAPREFDVQASKAPYSLRARMSPVDIETPLCFQRGKTEVIEFKGVDPDQVQNWRLISDNGSVDGLRITPKHAGDITLTLEVESPVTRQSGSLAPKSPRATKVSLGTFPVITEDCMVRLTMSASDAGHDVVLTFSYDGEYTEFSSGVGPMMYSSASDMMFFNDGHWQDLPQPFKAQFLAMLMQSTPMPDFLAPGEDEVALDGVFFGRMPHAFSKRFSWQNLRRVPGVDGKPVRRGRADCPRGGNGCTTVTFLMDGNPVPVIFDPHGRPAKVTFNNKGENAVMEFEYGNWRIRRPPGW